MKKDKPRCSTALERNSLSYKATLPAGGSHDAQARIDSPPSASLLVTDTPLSFWGGVDPLSGRVIDQHHPLHGESLCGRILVMPGSRGSCSGSGVLLELLMNDRAPAGLVFREPEEILTLGAVVAEELFGLSCPICFARPDTFDSLATDMQAVLIGGRLELSEAPQGGVSVSGSTAPDLQGGDVCNPGALSLSDSDRAMLDGVDGPAAQVAMRILKRVAEYQGARQLLDVTSAHIDGCVYNGRSTLLLAEKLVEMGARVKVPTTLNALSVDQRRWQVQGVDPLLGVPAAAVGAAYCAMGAVASYTCAPYLLSDPPGKGEHIGWAESNAVVFANSILGARTQKYPDFLDICIAICGRAPRAGCHLDAPRQPSVVYKLGIEPPDDDAFWPLLGHCVGGLSKHRVPAVVGVADTAPNESDLKAFCAAFATLSSSALCHIAGVTPEIIDNPALLDAADLVVPVDAAQLRQSWHVLNRSTHTAIELVCLGNPHFSADECSRLAELCDGKNRHPAVQIIITMGRQQHELAMRTGSIERLERFGVEFITDTCWCMLTTPVIAPSVCTLMTNSAKYAHYAPGLTGREVHFGNLAECVEVACSGQRTAHIPRWLQ